MTSEGSFPLQAKSSQGLARSRTWPMTPGNPSLLLTGFKPYFKQCTCQQETTRLCLRFISFPLWFQKGLHLHRPNRAVSRT